MRKTKAFKIIKELCGEAFSLADASPQELYISSAFETIDAAVSIINYFIVKENIKKRTAAEDAKIAEEAETYRVKLSRETEEMRRRFTAARENAAREAEKNHAVMETVRGMARELREAAEFVQKLKEALSGTEEDIKQNRQQIAELDEWLRRSTKNYYDLLEYYQIGGNEDE